MEGAGQGACLPLTSVPEQGPLEKVTGGKQSGSKTHREHVRAGTVNIHKSKVKSERMEKDIQSLRALGYCTISDKRQNNPRKNLTKKTKYIMKWEKVNLPRKYNNYKYVYI